MGGSLRFSSKMMVSRPFISIIDRLHQHSFAYWIETSTLPAREKGGVGEENV